MPSCRRVIRSSRPTTVSTPSRPRSRPPVHRSLKATDTTNSSFTGTESVVVQAASAQSLAISGLPATVTPGVATSFTATAYDLYGNVATGYTGTVQFTSTDPGAALPANFTFTSGYAGTHTFSATLSTLGSQTIFAADTVTASIKASASTTVRPLATATFMKSDTATQGNWQTVYGTSGYDILSDAVNIPAYANVSFGGQSPYTWTTTSSATPALETPGSTNRVAAAWYASNSFTIALNITDDQPHDIALYALDWDNKGRSEQIQISTLSPAQS